jgi:DNA-binding response OmpR family regulator
MTNNPKLMVVDNEIDICNFVKSFFEVRGFEVIGALNGDETLAKLETEKPDVILLDVMMRSDGEGLDYLPRIKEKIPSAKIIMVTGMEDRETIDAARKYGADDYITKPLVLEYLESTVMRKIKSLGVPMAR